MRKAQGKLLSWILFILLIIGAFILLLYLQKLKQAKEPAISPPTVTEPEVKLPPAKPGKEFAIQEVSDEEKETEDQSALAKALTAGSGCEDIKYDPELKQTCLDTLSYNTALKESSENLCNQIKDAELKSRCLNQVYFGLGTKNSDAFYCGKITEAALKQNCLDQIQVALAGTAQSAAECESIQDESLKKDCMDNFYFSSSIDSLNESGCNAIQDQDLKDRCSKTVEKNLEVIELSKTIVTRELKSSAEVLQGCDQLTEQESTVCSDEANYNLAFEKKDLAYCNAITDSTKQSQCIQTQSASINNYYLRQATSKHDPSLCNKILDATLRSACLQYAQ